MFVFSLDFNSYELEYVNKLSCLEFELCIQVIRSFINYHKI